MYNFNNTHSTYIYAYLVIQFLHLNLFQHFQHLQSLVQYLFHFRFQNLVSHHQYFEEYLSLFTLQNIFQISSSNKN